MGFSYLAASNLMAAAVYKKGMALHVMPFLLPPKKKTIESDPTAFLAPPQARTEALTFGGGIQPT